MRRWIAGGLVLTAATSQAAAQAPAPSLSLGLVDQAYVATETVIGGTAIYNQDRGRLRGLDLEASLPLDRTWGLRLGWQGLRGTLAYAGVTQLGMPLQTSTRLDSQAWRMALVHAWHLSAVPVVPQAWVGVASQRTRRDILASPLAGALTETLSHTDAQIGIELTWHPFGHVHPFALTLATQRSVGQRSRLRVNAYEAFDPLSLQPRGTRAQSEGVTARWGNADGRMFSIGWERESRRHGESDPQPALRAGRLVTFAQYPGSEATRSGWQATLRQPF